MAASAVSTDPAAAEPAPAEPAPAEPAAWSSRAATTAALGLGAAITTVAVGPRRASRPPSRLSSPRVSAVDDEMSVDEEGGAYAVPAATRREAKHSRSVKEARRRMDRIAMREGQRAASAAAAARSDDEADEC